MDKKGGIAMKVNREFTFLQILTNVLTTRVRMEQRVPTCKETTSVLVQKALMGKIATKVKHK